MKKNRKTSVTGELVNAKFIRNMEDKDLYSSIEAYKFLSQLRGTPPYWQKIKYDAIAHIKQHGSFTWFITFSFNDLIYSRARKLFGHLNARRCDFKINIIIPTRKPPLSVRN